MRVRSWPRGWPHSFAQTHTPDSVGTIDRRLFGSFGGRNSLFFNFTGLRERDLPRTPYGAGPIGGLPADHATEATAPPNTKSGFPWTGSRSTTTSRMISSAWKRWESITSRHHCVLKLKQVFYAGRGEPYEFDGHRLRYVPGSRPIRMRYLDSTNRVNRFDALQVMWLRTHLKEGDLAIDVGAHHGMYSMLMAAKCGPRGHVVAFEP